MLKNIIPIPSYAFRRSSSIHAVVGGAIVSLNIPISKYGFVILAISSGQMLFASLMDKDRDMTFYALSVFVFVDCLGIVRWTLQ